MAKHTRPRPNAIDMLPEECELIVAWAAQELGRSDRSQTEIYAEFRTKLIALQGEIGLGFDIPSFSSFNRHALRSVALSQRHKRARMLAEVVVDKADGEEADDITKAVTLTLKTLLLEMLESAGEHGFKPKEALAMAGAVRSLQIAENLSTTRRQKLDAEFSAKVEEVVDVVAKEKGLSKEASDSIKSEILGIRQ